MAKKKTAPALLKNTRKARRLPKIKHANSSDKKELLSLFAEKLTTDLLRAEQESVEEFCQRNLRSSIQAILKPFLDDYKEYSSRSDYGFALRHKTKRPPGSVPLRRDESGRRLCWQVSAYGYVDPGSSVPGRICPLDDRHYIENWAGDWAADPKSALRDFIKNTFPGICESRTSEALNRRSDRDQAREREED